MDDEIKKPMWSPKTTMSLADLFNTQITNGINKKIKEFEEESNVAGTGISAYKTENDFEFQLHY